MNRQQKIRIIIGVSAVLILAIIITVSLLIRNNPNAHQESYVDPATGQTLSDPEGKTPETAGPEDQIVTLVGGEKLLEIGISYDQLNLIKLLLNDYSKQVDGRYNEISLWVDKITGSSLPDKDVIEAPIIVKRHLDAHIIIESFDIDWVRVIIKDESKETTLYDSGNKQAGVDNAVDGS